MSEEQSEHRGETTLLDPKVDIVFKGLFGQERNTDLLQSLLNGVLGLLGEPPVVAVELLSPFSPIDVADDKAQIVGWFRARSEASRPLGQGAAPGGAQAWPSHVEHLPGGKRRCPSG